VTNRKSVRMLWANAMSPSRIASLCVVLLAVTTAIHCEPIEEAPQPMAPQNAMIPPPPPDVPPPAPPESAAAPPAGSDNMYASGEVAVGTETDGYDDDDPAALTDFHATLDQHGTWADDPTYGTVWVPSPTVVGQDFHPYVSAGHWAYDDDWVWVSDYDWGWAPFHYGRWVWIDGRGWSWIPGRVYRGAWVMWGVDDGYAYVGWAPMPPAFIWFGGVARPFPGYYGPRWVYCPRGEVFSASVRTRVVSGAAAAPIAAHVRPYVSARPGVAAAGPPPQKLGFQSAQIPRAGGAPSVARAQQFAHPSTAVSVGARAPTRVSPTQPVGQSPARVTGDRVPHATAAGPVASPPNTGRAPSTATMPVPGRTPSTGSVVHTPTTTTTGHAAPAPVAPAPSRGGGRGVSPSGRGGGGGGHHR
jgi:hypothetical protein